MCVGCSIDESIDFSRTFGLDMPPEEVEEMRRVRDERVRLEREWKEQVQYGRCVP